MSNTSKVFFVKSLEEDFHTKTLKRTKKVNFQSISDIIKTKRILLNTKSFGRKRRLSTTILSDHYLKTYRPQGIIFQTEQKPEYVLPCDIVLLSMADKIVVHYYRIKNNLHTYYNHQLIGGFERFIFKDFNSMIKKFRSPDSVWSAVNTFRKKAGYPILHREKHRLVEYNEVVFQRPVEITPIAVFGYRKEARLIAKKFNLPYYPSARDFWKKINRE